MSEEIKPDKSYFNKMLDFKLSDLLNQRQIDRLWKLIRQDSIMQTMPSCEFHLMVNFGLEILETKDYPKKCPVLQRRCRALCGIKDGKVTQES